MVYLHDIMNYRILTTETNLKAWYVFHSYFTTSSVKLFVVPAQVFVYKFLFTIVFFGKRKKKLTKPFTFWKWKHLLKKNHILKLRTPLEKEPHFENENICWSDCVVILWPFDSFIRNSKVLTYFGGSSGIDFLIRPRSMG